MHIQRAGLPDIILPPDRAKQRFPLHGYARLPEQEREQIIAFAAKIDVRAEAKKVMDALLASLSVQFELKGR